MTVRNNEGSIQSQMHGAGVCVAGATCGSAELQIPSCHPLAVVNVFVQLPRYWRVRASPGTQLDIGTCILTHKITSRDKVRHFQWTLVWGASIPA